MKIAVASNNPGKIKEFKSILEPLGYELLSAKELGVDMSEVIETGGTFAENALLKAEYLFEKTSLLSIADDSGLVINALPDILGVKSARFMGEDTDYSLKNDKILEMLKNKEDRSAYFISVIALCDENTSETFEGIINGHIAKTILGMNGFGYDPIFIPENYETSFGNMSQEDKNKISHRSRSLKKLMDYFNEI